MTSPSSLSAIAGLITLILVFLLTVPTFWAFHNKAKPKAGRIDFDEIDKLYEDRDGIATEETQKNYSAAIPKYISLSGSIIGFLASAIITAYTSNHPAYDTCVDGWLLFGTWVWTNSSWQCHSADSASVC